MGDTRKVHAIWKGREEIGKSQMRRPQVRWRGFLYLLSLIFSFLPISVFVGSAIVAVAIYIALELVLVPCTLCTSFLAVAVASGLRVS